MTDPSRLIERKKFAKVWGWRGFFLVWLVALLSPIWGYYQLNELCGLGRFGFLWQVFNSIPRFLQYADRFDLDLSDLFYGFCKISCVVTLFATAFGFALRGTILEYRPFNESPRENP